MLSKNSESLKKEAESYREGLVHRVAAWRMDYPEDTLDHEELFADITHALNEAFYEEKKDAANRIKRMLLDFLSVEDPKLNAEEKNKPSRSFSGLRHSLGIRAVAPWRLSASS